MLRDAIKNNEIIQKKIKKNKLEGKIIDIVVKFIKDNDFICYGGSAINALLPDYKKIYDDDIDIPDYDFFSSNAMTDAKKLAKIYSDEGYENVEAKSAMNLGTYKVFVNFIPIADITQMDKNIFDNLHKKSKIIKGIRYSPIKFLKMGLYLELSRPLGDISRWEKVYSRLELLNDIYKENLSINEDLYIPNNVENKNLYKKLFDLCVKNKWVLFGECIMKLFNRYCKDISIYTPKIPVIFILTDNVKKIVDKLPKHSIKLISGDHKFIGKIYKISINNIDFIYLFKTNSCMSYNSIKIKGNIHNIASIDTMLSIYYALSFVNIDSNFSMKNIETYSYVLENIHSNNGTNIMKRFYTPCIGTQKTLEDIKKERMEIYFKYRNNKNNKTYKKYFLRYNPKTKKNM